MSPTERKQGEMLRHEEKEMSLCNQRKLRAFIPGGGMVKREGKLGRYWLGEMGGRDYVSCAQLSFVCP